jgi:hypothetical protein
MVEMVGFSQVMWLVMLKSVKDRIIEVDTHGQRVPPHVRYGTTCLLIRNVVGSVPYSDEWEVTWSLAQAHMVQQGPWYCDYPRKP